MQRIVARRAFPRIGAISAEVAEYSPVEAQAGLHCKIPRKIPRNNSGEPLDWLGPVHTIDANANGWHGAPIKAAQFAMSDAKTGRLREEDNTEWRPMAPVPFGLLPKTLIAALQRLAG